MVTSGVSVDCPVRLLTVSQELFSLAFFSLRYSLYKSDIKTQSNIVEIEDIHTDQKE